MGFKTATELIEELDGRSASALGQSSSTGDDALGGVVFMCRYARERRQRESKVCAAGDGREFALQQPLPWRDLRHHRVFSRCPAWRLRLRAIVSSAWDDSARSERISPPQSPRSAASGLSDRPLTELPHLFTSLPQRHDLRRHDAERPLRPDPAVMVVRQGHPTGDAVIPL